MGVFNIRGEHSIHLKINPGLSTFLGWPLNPLNKSSYIGSPIVAIRENIKCLGVLPRFQYAIESATCRLWGLGIA